MTATSAPPPALTRTRIRVRPLAPGDLAATAAWQASAPSDGPGALGPAFARRWQLAHVDSPHAVALVAEHVDDGPAHPPGSPSGLLLAVTDPRAHHAHVLRRHGRHLAAAGAAGSLGRPRVLGRWLRDRSGPLVEAVTLLPTRGGSAARARRTPAPASTAVDGGATVVATVVVDPRVRGTGVGRHLLDALVDQLAAAGTARAEVRVPWGSGAEGFFRACGWTASPTRPSPRGGLETPFRHEVPRHDDASLS